MSVFKALKHITKKKPPTCSAVIAAAGSSLRCKGEDKLLFIVNGKPLLVYTIEAFQSCNLINEIIVVTKPEQLTVIADMCMKYDLPKVSGIIAGGESRTQSVCNGIYAASKKNKLIAIHDGARPCVKPELIEKTIMMADEYHAAAPGIAVVSTIKKVENTNLKSYGMVISDTVDRDNLIEIQTPQVFRTEIIKAGITKSLDKSIPLTDDCMAAELLGIPVHVVEGSRCNIKVTEPDDLKMAEALLRNR